MVKVHEPGWSRLEQMQNAVAAINAREMSIRQAAKSFGVVKSNLQRRTSKQVSMDAKRGPTPVMTEGEVQGVLDAVGARTNRGQCFTSAEIGTFPSASWANGFIRDNKASFGRRNTQTLTVCRAKASTEENVGINYRNLKKVLESCSDLPPSRISNFDETGMSGQGSGRKPKVLTTKGKRANIQKSDSRVNVSALVCANADGSFIPPFVIFPGQNVTKSHTLGGIPDANYASSKSSFLVTSLFIQYFGWFVTRIPPERPVLLIMDGYKSQFSVRMLECARRNGIHLYALPAHTSHFLQPMDVGVFNHFKKNLDEQINAYQKQKKLLVVETNIVAVSAPAFKAALARAHIVGAFENTGIHPLSRSKMMEGITGDEPTKGSKNTILLKPVVIITERTTRKIERSGDNVDRVRVASINHWIMEERSLTKKPK